MQLLDGKATAATIREELRAEIAALTPRAFMRSDDSGARR